MKLSIIVPVYNIECFIEQCVNSVRQQYFSDWEMILVDDGSVDKSGQLCDSFAEIDSRIKVIHKKNGGLSDARNFGLMAAMGEYIHFMDGDDYNASPKSLSLLLSALESLDNPDVLLFCRTDYYEGSGKKNYERPYDVDFINNAKCPTDIFSHLLYAQRFNMSACFQLLRRKFLLENNIFFEKGLLSEDVDWSILLWQQVRTVKAVNCHAYCYRHRSSSISSTISLKTYLSYQFIFSKWTPKLLAMSTAMSDLQLAYLASLYATLLYLYYICKRQDRGQVYLLLKDMSYILSFGKTVKAIRTKNVLKIFGFYLTCNIFAIYGYVSKRIRLF